jgi:hypothetical protein
MKKAQASDLALTADTYALLAVQGTADEAKKSLAIEDRKGPIEMVLGDAKIFQRVLARYLVDEMTPESQPGSPSYDPAKSPPAGRPRRAHDGNENVKCLRRFLAD